MYFVYIIQSQKDKTYYAGETENLKQRIYEHNHGFAKYSSTKGPWILIWYGVFKTKQKALQFEKYIKSGSGFAFRNKHLI